MAIYIYSGAGLSVSSGIPLFRGETGLWNRHKIKEVCDWHTWMDHYDLVHEFYDTMRCDLQVRNPGEEYSVLKEISALDTEVVHMTSNIDDLYEKSKLSVHHIHGKLTEIKCVTCGEISDIGYHRCNDAVKQNLIKHKPACNNHQILKPNVTFFNEAHNEYRFVKNIIQNINPDDTFLIIGSSLQVIPVDYWLRYTTCKKININPNIEAGFGKDYKNFLNIKEEALTGLKRVSGLLIP